MGPCPVEQLKAAWEEEVIIFSYMTTWVIQAPVDSVTPMPTWMALIKPSGAQSKTITKEMKFDISQET